MQIIHENATAKLLEKVKTLEPLHHSSWRCIHFNLWANAERYNHGLRAHFIARALIERLGDLDGYMYLCDDGDIFVFFQGPVKAIVKRLGAHFEDVTSDMSRADKDNRRFAIYDLSVEWQQLYELCRDKLLDALSAPEGFYACFAYSPEMVSQQ